MTHSLDSNMIDIAGLKGACEAASHKKDPKTNCSESTINRSDLLETRTREEYRLARFMKQTIPDQPLPLEWLPQTEVPTGPFLERLIEKDIVSHDSNGYSYVA